MIRSTTRRLFEPLDGPEQEIHRRRKSARRHPPNESLNIAGRNIFNEEVSSSRNAEPAITLVPKTLHEHSRPNQAGFQNSITFPEEQTDEVLDAHDIWLIQSVCEFHGLDTENPYDHIRLFLSIVDNIQADGATKDASRLRFFHFTLKGEEDPWDDTLSHEYVSLASELTKPTMDDRMKRAHQQLSYLTTLTYGKSLKNAYLICDICGGAHEDDEYDQNISHEQVCLSGGDFYDDPSLLKLYQDNDIPPWGNYIKEEGEEDLHWVLQSKFEDDMANFMMEKKHHLNRLREMLD
nr:DNA-directed DNA polymerase [Tanacetum cinerariifolium]